VKKILLFNPRSANAKHRIPNSILQVGASIEGRHPYVIVDGNMERDPWARIDAYLATGEFGVVGMTVMPGQQLRQAIPYVRRIRERYPDIVNVWGGYFPANQYRCVLRSGAVDYVINGPGDEAFPQLLAVLDSGGDPAAVGNLIFLRGEECVLTPKAPLGDQDALPPLPYETLDRFYPLGRYLGKTFLGSRTAAYHSSMGCPFTCSFCAVVPIYEAGWKGKSATRIHADLQTLKARYGADAVEFHDNNFFVSEKRTVEFARLMRGERMQWWGEGRIDTVHHYSDASLALMRESGCRMIFFGAETGNDAILKKMDKGGTQTGAQIEAFARRMKEFDIIPEYSFVLGLPGESPAHVRRQIREDIAFIRKIKDVNPDTEIILYVYSPVPTEGSELYADVAAAGFRFPERLEEWLSPAWEEFDLRKNPLTPWLEPDMVDAIRNFETVLNARYPTVSDFKLTPFQRRAIRALSSARYASEFYRAPYELKALQRFWLRYRRPEVEGFYAE
jgi:radical SAM superfamily enzyme YgiQ (UPF0313 family)